MFCQNPESPDDESFDVFATSTQCFVKVFQDILPSKEPFGQGGNLRELNALASLWRA